MNNYYVWVAMDTGLGYFTIPASIYQDARNDNAASPAGNYSFFSAANFASTMNTVTTAALAAAVGSSGASGAAAKVKSSAGIPASALATGRRDFPAPRSCIVEAAVLA